MALINDYVAEGGLPLMSGM